MPVTHRDEAVENSPLPPSVEKAYHKKCIELKRRLRDVEDSNDAARRKLLRLERGIMKMRINRAFLLDHLQKLQQSNPDAETEPSESPPPTPPERTVRETSAKRNSQTQHGSQPNGHGANNMSPFGTESHSYAPQETPYRSSGYPSQLVPTPPHAAPTAQPTPPGPYTAEYPHAPYASQQVPSLPMIRSLPNGTSVRLIKADDGQTYPQTSPWTIHDLDPRHHIIDGFDALPLATQEVEIFDRGHLPFDVYGSAVVFEYDDARGNYHYVYPHDPAYKNPVVQSERTDSLSNSKRTRITRPPPSAGSPTWPSVGSSGGFTAANR